MIIKRKYDNNRYVFTECWSTQFYKTNTTGHKGTDPNRILAGDFNTLLLLKKKNQLGNISYIIL
jgi:hypothetical protein